MQPMRRMRHYATNLSVAPKRLPLKLFRKARTKVELSWLEEPKFLHTRGVCGEEVGWAELRCLRLSFPGLIALIALHPPQRDRRAATVKGMKRILAGVRAWTRDFPLCDALLARMPILRTPLAVNIRPSLCATPRSKRVLQRAQAQTNIYRWQ
jgi:hypothetical protein